LKGREEKINEIITFVDRYKDSLASKTVCARILGNRHIEIDDDVIEELKHRLPRSDEEELEACYYLVK
jgi:hypothetical protein